MLKTLKLVVAGSVAIVVLAFLIFGIDNRNVDTRSKEPDRVFVGMLVYSSGLAPIGKVSKIIRDTTGAIRTVQIRGNASILGIRQITPSMYSIPARYMTVKLHRHEFRALPRIDKKK